MIVTTKRKRLLKKFLASSVFVIPGIYMIYLGLMELTIKYVIIGTMTLVFFPFFIRSFFYLFKPKTLFMVNEGFLISEKEKINLSLTKFRGWVFQAI